MLLSDTPCMHTMSCMGFQQALKFQTFEKYLHVLYDALYPGYIKGLESLHWTLSVSYTHLTLPTIYSV